MAIANEIKNIEEKVVDKMPAMGESIVNQALAKLKINTESPSKEELRKLVAEILELTSSLFEENRREHLFMIMVETGIKDSATMGMNCNW